MSNKEWETLDPRELEERKYRAIWQVLKSQNDTYAKYRVVEKIVDGILSEERHLARSEASEDVKEWLRVWLTDTNSFEKLPDDLFAKLTDLSQEQK